jgi:hypothetical protein
VQNSLFERQETGLFVNFGKFLFIILDPDQHFQYDTNPDPRQPKECGSGSTTLVLAVGVVIADVSLMISFLLLIYAAYIPDRLFLKSLQNLIFI